MTRLAAVVVALTTEVLIAAVVILYAARHRLRRYWASQAARRAEKRQDAQALRDIRAARDARLADVTDARIVLLAAAHELSAAPDAATGTATPVVCLMDETTVRMPRPEPGGRVEAAWPQPIPQTALDHLRLWQAEEYAGRHWAGER